MKIYLDSRDVYTIRAAALDVQLPMSAGLHNLVAQAWDTNGAVFKKGEYVSVNGVNIASPLNGAATGQLVQSLESEIKRSRRTAQPLAVVLLDLDGLKQINDRHGHLAGSLAIRRVAEALLGSCRATDTAARFGGDEFALVLPETGEAAAWHVARGVANRLATDAEKPNLSISVGVAVYPGHGETVEALLNAADVALYETKERRKSKAAGLAP